MDNFCLCCARKNDNLSEINKKGNRHPENETALKMLQIFNQIEITSEDSLSKKICSDCLLQLQNAFDFYMNIKKSQTILRNLLDQIKRKSLPWILPKNSTMQYKCSLCTQLFETRSDLLNHIKKELLKRKRMRNLKGKRKKISSNVRKTKKESSLKQIHFRVEKSDDDKESSQLQQQQQQQTDHSVSNFNNLCKFCNIFFSDDNEYKNHKASHSWYKCKKCLKEFSIQDHLIQHMQETYEDCSFYCNECKKNPDYQGEQELNEHINECHPNQQHQQNEEKKLQLKNDENKTNVIENAQDDGGDLFTDVEFLDEFFLNQDDNLHLNEYWENISLTFDDLNDKEVEVFKDKTDCEENQNLMDDNENNTINYKCPKCKKSIRSQQELYIHLAHEHDEPTLICNSCGDSFNRIDDLKLHRREKCLKIKKETFIDNNQFGNILIKSSSSPSDEGKTIYKCLKCELIFANQTYATNHDCKNKLNRIRCTFCLQLFPNLQKMYMHRKAVHFNELVQCKVCNKTFATTIGLKYHLKIHAGSKHYPCPYCSQKFTANINLSSHIKNIHSLSKAYVCNLCDARFSTTNHLRKHVTSVHQKERNFLCNTCGKRYAQSSHLKQHELSHTGERKNVCSICSKGYIRAIDLMKHIQKMHPSAAVS